MRTPVWHQCGNRSGIVLPDQLALTRVRDMKLGLREANQQFSKAIKAVRAGKEVILTERGHPIAVIKPIKDEDSLDVSIQAMVDEGFLRPATREGRTNPALAAGEGEG